MHFRKHGPWGRTDFGLSSGSDFLGAGPSLVVQTVKNLPAMWETQVQPLGGEDPLEKGWQPTPVVLPGESHGQRSLVGYSPWGCK